MNIGMILDNTFPPDIRVEKEARALSQAGHNIFVLAYENPQKNQLGKETLAHCIVHRIPRQKVWQRLDFFFTHFDRYWAQHIREFVKTYEIDVLHVHDLPMTKTTMKIGKEISIPVVVDLHENYPVMMQVAKTRKASLNARLKQWLMANTLNNHTRWVAYEQQTVQEAEYIVVVVEEAIQRYVQQHQAHQDKFTVVMNTEDLNYFKHMELDAEIMDRYKNDFVVSYIGGGGRHRGLDIAVQAMTHLKGVIPNIRLVLVGVTNPDEYHLLSNLVTFNNLNNVVEINGWQPFHKVPSYISASDICLIPHRKSAHTEDGIPHKFFQYMLLGKPLVVSNCRPYERIIEDSTSGLVFESGNPVDLANKIQELAQDDAKRHIYGENARLSVEAKYNWEIEGQHLTELYTRIEQMHKVKSNESAN